MLKPEQIANKSHPHIAAPIRSLAIPIDSLHPDPANARTHNQRNLDTIAASLARFGQRAPIVVQKEGMVIRAGNGRFHAAKKLGWTHIAALVIDEPSVDAAAFSIADNRSSELAEWDDESLAAILQSLPEESLPDTGFTQAELDGILRGLAPEITEDESPEPPENPVSKPGDIWQCGRHRVMCGDCRNKEDAAALFRGEKISVAVTSPPYAAQRKYDVSSGFKTIPPDQYVEWFGDVQSIVSENLLANGSWFVNIKEHCEEGERHTYCKHLLLAHVELWGWKWVDEFAWIHGGTPKSVMQRFKNGWEPIYQFTKGRHKFNPKNVTHKTDDAIDWRGAHPSQNDGLGMVALQGERDGVGARGAGAVRPGMAYPSNVLSVGKNREAIGHGAAYPVALPAFFIKAFSDENDHVYDPFLGSGTTMIAAEQLGRTCFGMEISPAYVDICVQRWEKLTNSKATLANRDRSGFHRSSTDSSPGSPEIQADGPRATH